MVTHLYLFRKIVILQELLFCEMDYFEFSLTMLSFSCHKNMFKHKLLLISRIFWQLPILILNECMNDFISHIKIIQHVYLAVTFGLGRKTKETLAGFYKVVSLLKIIYLNLANWYQKLEL